MHTFSLNSKLDFVFWRMRLVIATEFDIWTTKQTTANSWNTRSNQQIQKLISEKSSSIIFINNVTAYSCKDTIANAAEKNQIKRTFCRCSSMATCYLPPINGRFPGKPRFDGPYVMEIQASCEIWLYNFFVMALRLTYDITAWMILPTIHLSIFLMNV